MSERRRQLLRTCRTSTKPYQTTHPSLLLEPAGNVGSVGRGVVKLLRERDLQVRALVHRLDERSQVLSEMGAELVVADLTNGADVLESIARLQADVFWHEYLVTISSSYGYGQLGQQKKSTTSRFS